MSLTAQEIYLTKSRKIIVPQGIGRSRDAAIATFNRNLMSVGFVCSPALTTALRNVSETSLNDLYQEILPILKKITGSHRTHQPFYPNFPKQVMDASDLELYSNAMTHYWAAAARDQRSGQPRLFGGPLMPGTGPLVELLNVPAAWLPEYTKEEREELPDAEITLRVIGPGTEEDFYNIFTRIVGANGSVSNLDKEIISWFVENRPTYIPEFLPPLIPNKENLTYLFAQLSKYEFPEYLLPFLKTGTDVLRVAVALSDGDVSLAKPCKFRRFQRADRRLLLQALESSPSLTEDMLRRPEVWKRLGRELRPGDYKDRYPKTFAAFDVVRNDRPFETFNGQIEKLLRSDDYDAAVELLATRPGDFVRRLDHLLRLSAKSTQQYIVQTFGEVAEKVSTPVLLQTFAHFQHRHKASDFRSFFPKGNVAKVQVTTENQLPPLSNSLVCNVTETIHETLVNRFRTRPSLGKVYIDERLRQQIVPFAQRSASKSLRTLTRGSRLSIPDCSVLRFFVWWKEPKGIRTDIDLAAVMLNDDFSRVADISYYNLRDFGSAHSGDITSAPNGASEYIDINLEKVLQAEVRYVLMSIYSYTQQAFKDLPECFAGWMARSKALSGEVFDARTVQDKIDIAGDTTVNIPLIIDLKEREVIWSDLALKSRGIFNHSLSSENNLSKMARAMANLQKPTLYDLFAMHATARSSGLVNAPSEADTIFGLHEGTVTAFDADKIMSEYMA